MPTPSKLIDAITGDDPAKAVEAVDEFRAQFRSALDLDKPIPCSKADAQAILEAILGRVADWRLGDRDLWGDTGPSAFTIDDRSGYHLLLDGCRFRAPKKPKTEDE